MRLKPLKTGFRDPGAAVKASDAKPPRIHSLDAMRGVFSLVVIMGHFCLTMPASMERHWYPILVMTPLRWGYAFVVTFFMLSGFVLALPYATARAPDYRSFLIRRISRLYIPFAAITLLTFLLYSLTGVSPAAINDVSYRADNLILPPRFTPLMLGGSLLMTGLREHSIINFATWTLVYEMRIAFIFPLLVALCRRPWFAVAFMAACYVFVWFAKNSLGHYAVFPALTDDELSTWLTTLYITPCVMFGILLAGYGEKIRDFLAGQPTFIRVILWILVFVNFSFMPDFQIPQPFTEFASALLILLVLSSDVVDDLASTPILQWLGRVSYSTYLVHLPILFALRSLWEGKIALIWLYVICLALTFPAAALAYRFIEIPARNLARKWTRRIS